MNSKGKFLILIASLLCNSFALAGADANDVTMKLEGLLHFQSGFRNQNKLVGEEKNVSNQREGFGFFTEAAIMALAQKQQDEVKYGAQIILMPSTKVKTTSSYNGSHLFLESEFGKVELGSPFDASTKMMIGGYDIAAGTGDGWGRYAKLDGAHMKSSGMAPEFVDYYGKDLIGDYQTKTGMINDSTEPPRMISYFTPKFSSIQVGISYIPDTNNVGGAALDKEGIKSDTINKNLQDVVAGGVSYEYHVSDGVDLKLAVTGQYSKRSKKAPIVTTDVQTFNLNPLKAYNVGGILTYGNMSYNLAYGSMGNSLTSSGYNHNGRDTSYYGGAIAYGQGPLKSSIAYFQSNQYKNKLNFISVATEYSIMPGLLPYAELSYFQAKGKPSYVLGASDKKAKGTIVLIGTKLKF